MQDNPLSSGYLWSDLCNFSAYVGFYHTPYNVPGCSSVAKNRGPKILNIALSLINWCFYISISPPLLLYTGITNKMEHNCAFYTQKGILQHQSGKRTCKYIHIWKFCANFIFALLWNLFVMEYTAKNKFDGFLLVK